MALPIIGLLAGGIGGAALSLAAFAPGFGDIVTSFMNGTFRARIPTPAELGRMRQMGLLTEEDYEALMPSTGYSESNTRKLWDSFLDALNVQDIVRLYFRYRDNPTSDYNTDASWLRRRLTQAGIREDALDEIVEANRPVPTLQDEIVFAVRDVYDPEQVEQAQLLSGIPEEWVKRVSRLGLRREDAEKFWAAHWSLPSLTEIYEMFHRLYPGSGHDHVFTEKDMDIFFNLADIAPGYRDRLKEISYNPLTRVDIRRMYAYGQYGTGSFATQQLIRDYRQLGYSPENAERLAKFTIDEYGEGRKRFTQAQITKFYVNSLWGEDSRKQAVTELKRLGYDDAQAELLLSYIDLQELSAEEADKIETVRQRFLAGEFPDQVALENALVKIPVSVETARKLEAQFERDRLKASSRLSRSEVDSLYRNNLLTEKQYRTYLQGLGYISKDIDLIVKLLGKARIAPLAKPAKEDILGWYSDGIISAISFLRLMREIGFRDELIQYYASAAGSPLPEEITHELADLPEDDDYEI